MESFAQLTDKQNCVAFIVDACVNSRMNSSPFSAAGASFEIHEWRGSGPATLHVHNSDDEAWHVLAGELIFRYSDRTEIAGPGRVLQEREFERVGGTGAIKVDVRVIAATNRDPAKAILETTFRQDLYYRLNVFPISLPPLRERSDDVPLLVQHLVRKFSGRIGVRIESVAKSTMERLSRYTWPGNIRELENILERAVILSNGPTLEIDQTVFASVSASSSTLVSRTTRRGP